MLRVIVSCVPLVLALAACNSASTSQNVSLLGPLPRAPAVTASPAGAGCNEVIARYRFVTKTDADTGNSNATVYSQIDGEIRKAEAACQAGRDGEARSLVAASKARHGYPVGN